MSELDERLDRLRNYLAALDDNSGGVAADCIHWFADSRGRHSELLRSDLRALLNDLDLLRCAALNVRPSATATTAAREWENRHRVVDAFVQDAT